MYIDVQPFVVLAQKHSQCAHVPSKGLEPDIVTHGQLLYGYTFGAAKHRRLCPVPNYTIWWRRQFVWTNCSESVPGNEMAESKNRDFLIPRRSKHYTTAPHHTRYVRLDVLSRVGLVQWYKTYRLMQLPFAYCTTSISSCSRSRLVT